MAKYHVTAGFLSLLIISLAADLTAAGPVLLDYPVFAVATASETGVLTGSFDRGETPHFEVRFALTLSAVRSYHVRITLFQVAGDEEEESTTLYEGTLPEGSYRLLAGGGDPPGWGEVSYRVVMQVRMFKERYTGDDFYAYREQGGVYRYGY